MHIHTYMCIYGCFPAGGSRSFFWGRDGFPPHHFGRRDARLRSPDAGRLHAASARTNLRQRYGVVARDRCGLAFTRYAFGDSGIVH